MNNKSKNQRSGFTLLEMAIVVICVGLLVTIFVVGGTIIRASKVNQEVVKMTSYKSAVSSWASTYQCMPGDCKDASTFVNTNEELFPGSNCIQESSAGISAGNITSCDGDGNGRIEGWEGFKFWAHLEMGGFVKALQYIQKAYRPSSFSKIAAYAAAYGHFAFAGSPNYYDNGTLPSYNYISLSGFFGGVGFWGPIFTPADAASMDAKMDDGKPNSGKVLGFLGDVVVAGSLEPKGPCITSGDYAYSNSDIACFVTYRIDD